MAAGLEFSAMNNNLLKNQGFVWTGGRVVEGARLESVYRGNSIAGSNPALSAMI
jgi:hypothetical protein